jgi:hypothetical protein
MGRERVRVTQSTDQMLAAVLTPRRESRRSARWIERPVANAVLTTVVDTWVAPGRRDARASHLACSGDLRWTCVDLAILLKSGRLTVQLPSRPPAMPGCDAGPLGRCCHRACCHRAALPNLAVLDQGGSAALRRARTGLRPWGADAVRRAGRPVHDPMIGQDYRQRYRCGVCRLPRRTSVPVAATASRTTTASHAIASRPVTRRPLARDARL